MPSSRKVRSTSSSVLILSATVAAAACGDDSDVIEISARCIPGETRACLGRARCPGVQVCSESGDSLSVCLCGDGSQQVGGAAGGGWPSLAARATPSRNSGTARYPLSPRPKLQAARSLP